MSTQSNITDDIRGALRARIEKIAAEVTEEAKKEIERRIGEEMDTLALTLLRRYEIVQMADRIVIEVRKP